MDTSTSTFKQVVKALTDNGDNIGLVEGWNGMAVTFSDMLLRSSSLARGLRRIGVAVGDSVVLCSDKSIAAFDCLLGVMLSGATPVIIPTPNADMMDRLTKGHAVKAVMYDSRYGDLVIKSVCQMTPPATVVTTMDPEDPVMASLLEASPHELEEYRLEDPKSHVIATFFSSGTTGQPKGIPITSIRQGLHLREDGPLLLTTPFYMVSVFVTFMSSICKNFTLILTDQSSPKYNLRLIEKYKAKGWLENPGLLNRYVIEACPHNNDVTSLQFIILVGNIVMSSVTPRLFTHVLRGHDVVIVVPYGSTEVGCVARLVQPASEPLDLGACGAVCQGVQLKVVDSEGAEVEVGVVGELWVKSPTMTSGYWGQPELNKAFDEDGFFHTGDTGFLDDKGCLYVTGRVDDVINYGGFNKISPSEVEDVLFGHPDVVDAAVVGTPHPDDSQHNTAFVVTRAGASVTSRDIAAFVDGKVMEQMRLSGGVRIVKSLPRTASGKIKRIQLRQFVTDSR